MSTLKEAIHLVHEDFINTLAKVESDKELEQVRIDFLGRNGKVSHLMDSLKKLSLSEKQTFGPLLNELKEKIHAMIMAKKEEVTQKQVEKELSKYAHFDVTASYYQLTEGSLHPLTIVCRRIENIFISMGYSVAHGPEVETEYNNFEALNIPGDHPARDMWDTLWLTNPGFLLRTHTSTVQIRTMLSSKPPIAIVAPGRAFRHEATDATHDFMFNQIECLLVSENVSMSHLLGTITEFFKALFNNEQLTVRIRPSYFPFVEPGFEVDISCPFCTQGCSACKRTRWIEIGGAGLVHPHVLKSCTIDTEKYSGFAFGFGLDRITMLKYNINDIRLFSSNKIAFLEQF